MSANNSLPPASEPTLEQRVAALEKDREPKWVKYLNLGIAVAAFVAAGASAWYTEKQAAQARLQVEQAKKDTGREAWSVFLSRHDGDEMWEARRNLRQFRETLRQHPEAPKDDAGFQKFLTDTSNDFFSVYVYRTRKQTPTDLFPEWNPPAEEKDFKEKYFANLDKSRRRVRTFFDTVRLNVESGLIEEKAVTDRWQQNTAMFLETIWLPIERGQNQSLYGPGSPADERAVRLVEWYKQRLK